MSSERRYSDEEIDKILELATESPSSGATSMSSGAGMTLAEIQDIGREVGISEEVIARAAGRLDAGALAPSFHREFLGTTIGVGRTLQLSRLPTEAEWDRLVVDLRETFDARGTIGVDGSFRQWTNGNLQALIEPTEAGAQLRLKTVKGDATVSLGLGAAAVTLAPVTLVAAVLTGFAADPFVLARVFLLAAVGAAVLAVSRFRLLRWAEKRESQMAAIAERLAAAIDGADGSEEVDG